MLVAALFWGAVWGLGEATLGHLLHLVRVPGLPGLVMAPFAVWIMGKTAARSRSASAVFFAGAVAAGFKLLDLAIPGTDLLALSRPIQAILLEALAAAVWVRLTKTGTFCVFSGPYRGAGPSSYGGCSSFPSRIKSPKRPHFSLTESP
jgi:hypothetical protein